MATHSVVLDSPAGNDVNLSAGKISVTGLPEDIELSQVQYASGQIAPQVEQPKKVDLSVTAQNNMVYKLTIQQGIDDTLRTRTFKDVTEDNASREEIVDNLVLQINGRSPLNVNASRANSGNNSRLVISGGAGNPFFSVSFDSSLFSVYTGTGSNNQVGQKATGQGADLVAEGYDAESGSAYYKFIVDANVNLPHPAYNQPNFRLDRFEIFAKDGSSSTFRSNLSNHLAGLDSSGSVTGAASGVV